jgi:hypothetical protein
MKWPVLDEEVRQGKGYDGVGGRDHEPVGTGGGEIGTTFLR